MQCTAYGFLRLWYKYELRKYSPKVKFTFRAINRFLSNSGTPILREIGQNIMTKRENFLTSNLYHKRRNAWSVA